MFALEISVNGRIIQTIGVGDRGVISAGVNWDRIDQASGNVTENIMITSQGLVGNKGGALQWPTWYPDIGDEVIIRIVERDEVDPGEEVLLPPRL
jgi:hypothetical protein